MGTGFSGARLMHAGATSWLARGDSLYFWDKDLNLTPCLRGKDFMSRTLMLEGVDSINCTLLRNLKLRSLGLNAALGYFKEETPL